MSDAMLAALAGAVAGAVISAIISVVGWRVAARQSAESRRQEAALEHLGCQIEELYGPLYGLIQQARVVRELVGQIVPTEPDGQLSTYRFSEEHWEAWRYFTENYFLPLNSQIRELIRAKVYLLLNGTMPQSFEDFFRHEVHYAGRHQLWKETGIDTQSLPGVKWPPEFGEDVKKTLDSLMERHQRYLQRLTGL
jgi:hypothetical protein